VRVNRLGAETLKQCRGALVPLAALALLSAVLVFPEPVAKLTRWAPAACAVAALAAATIIATSRLMPFVVVGGLSVSLVAAWLRADNMPTVLSHFSNASLGVLWFAVILRWANTPARLRIALWLSTLGFTAAVAVGYSLVSAGGTSGPKFLPWASPDRNAEVLLPGMTQSVNRNVVGILAVAATPLMFACASAAARSGRSGLWRVLPFVSIPVLLLIVVESQSASVYAAAVAVSIGGFVGRRSPRWRLRLALALGAIVIVLLLPALLSVPMPPPSASILRQMTPDGVSLSTPDEQRGPSGGLVAVLRESNTPGLHELRKVVRVPSGPYAMTAIVKPMGSAGVMLYGGWYARLDMVSGKVDDLAARVAWSEPLDGGWLALRNVFLSSSPADVHFGLRLLNPFPNGEQYSGDPQRGILISGVYLQPPSTGFEYAAMTSVLFTAAVRRSLAARRVIWDQAAALVRATPFSGIGLDMARHKFGGTEAGVHAHNFMLQTMLDLGIPGALVMLALLAVFVRAMAFCWNDGSSEIAQIGWQTGLAMLAFQVFGLVDAIALGAKVGLLFWLTGGVLTAAYYISLENRVGPRSWLN
jgi:hypothetical protein